MERNHPPIQVYFGRDCVLTHTAPRSITSQWLIDVSLIHRDVPEKISSTANDPLYLGNVSRKACVCVQS